MSAYDMLPTPVTGCLGPPTNLLSEYAWTTFRHHCANIENKARLSSSFNILLPHPHHPHRQLPLSPTYLTAHVHTMPQHQICPKLKNGADNDVETHTMGSLLPRG